MKFSIALLGFLSASASALSIGNLVRGGDKIPGESPLELCDREHDDDILYIDNVNIAPNPPQAGQDLVIEASGTLSETIERGAYVLLTVKYGLIRLVSTKADLCEQIHNVDLECPLEKGPISVIKTVSLPAEIPPGKYSVLADVYTKDDEPITCLTATVVFRKDFSGFEL